MSNRPSSRRKTRPKPQQSDDKGGKEKVYGKHSVRAALIARPNDILQIFIAGKEDYHGEVIELAHRRDIPIFLVPWPEFEKAGRFAEDEKHQGIFCFTKPRRIYGEQDLKRLNDAKAVLLLDQLSNPQNLATIIRSAAFFRFDALVYMKHRAATPTAEVVRFAVGGAEMIDLYRVANLASAMDALAEIGFNVLGLDERGERTLAQVEDQEKLAFVIGAEGEGLRPKTRDRCRELVKIPGGRNGVESLNAAVAATIAMYEAKRLVTS